MDGKTTNQFEYIGERKISLRQLAIEVLHKYMQKGFAINDDFLKNIGYGVYWKEPLEGILNIRAGEKVMYRQILASYATTLFTTRLYQIDLYKLDGVQDGRLVRFLKLISVYHFNDTSF